MLNTKQKISFALSALLISSQVYAIDVSYQSHIKPSNIALDAVRNKGGNAPKITQANNGIPVVDIADANNAGISNNYFTDFNVGKEGLIFNNSKDLFVNTTLAGYINGNSNLTNEASLILTQVTGSNPSSLLGVMEIAGKRADLIIANPNGITCNGCGVLNAKSFTLSTGVISQEEIDRVNNINELNKTLTMMTQRGHINIEALNASNVEKLNIIAKSASVNGNLLASDLQFILGENKVFFDLSNKSDASLLLYEAITTKNAEGEEQKALALDVAHLGSVVANSIYLVATDEGVGVKNSGTMATIGSKEEGDGGFVIDVNGIVTISAPQSGKSTLDKDGSAPTLSSSANLEIKAKELHNGSIISADTDVNITADKVENISTYKIDNVIVSHNHDTDFMWGGKYIEDDWTVEQRISEFSPAIIQSGNNLTITADSITNTMGYLTAGANATFVTQTSFENKMPKLKAYFYERKFADYSPGLGKDHYVYDRLARTWEIDGNLPQFNIQDLVLSNQEVILSNALIFASTPTYTQEDRSKYTDLSSYLASSSYQEYVKSHYDRDPNYSDALLQKEIEFAVQKDTYRQQNAQAINTVFDNLERRLQETKEAKENIDPNELTSAGISAENVKIEGGEITNELLIQAGHIAVIGDSVINENGTIVSREDLNIQAGDFKNFGADLIARDDMTINADSVEIGTTKLVGSIYGGEKTELSNLIGNNITINSNNDAKFTSVNMEANNNLSIGALGNVLFETAMESYTTTSLSHGSWFFGFAKTDSTVQISNSLKGNNVSISSGKNLTANNLGIQAKNDVVLKADGDITLTTKEDKHHTERFFTGKKEDKTDLTDYNVQAINGNNITISAGQNAHLSSVDIGAEKDLSISATGDVLLDTLVKKQVDTTKTESTKVGWFKTTKTTTTTITTTNTNIANNLSGNSISISSKKDLTGFNVKADAKENLTMSAGNDLILSTNEDEKHIHEEKVEKSFGFNVHKEDNPIRKNVGISLGYTETTTDTNTNIKTHNNQTLSANNITLSSGSKTILESVDTKSENISISGKDVTITAKEDKFDQTINKKEEFWGVGVSVGINTYIPGVEVGAGYANTETTSKDTLYQTSTSSANINANNITITTADKQGNLQGDINIIGSNLNGSEIALSGEDVNIKAHQTEYKKTHTSTSQNKFQTGIYGGVGFDGIGMGGDIYAIIRKAVGDFTDIKLPPQKLDTSYQESSGNSHTGSNLMGTNITITSKKDTNIVGSSVNAKGDTTITGKNVNVIASIDKKTSIQTQIKDDVRFGLGASTSILDIQLDAYLQGKVEGSISTNVNNSSITSGNLTINTTKGEIDLAQAKENHKEIGDSFQKLTKNINNYIQAKKDGNGFKQAIALAGITSNGVKMVGSIKNSIALDAKNLNIFLGNTLFGNVNILGGNLEVNNVSMNVAGDLNIWSTQSHSASGKLDLTLKTGSLASGYIDQLANIEGNLQGNLTATIKEQSGIKADKVEITTNRNTSLTNAYISATDESSSIKTNTMTKLDFKDLNLNINQNVNADGNLTIDKWAGNGLINKEFYEIEDDIKNGQTATAIKKISDMVNLQVGGYGKISGTITSNPSSISQGIKVEIGEKKNEPKNVFRGEAQEAKRTEGIKPLYNYNGNFWVKK